MMMDAGEGGPRLSFAFEARVDIAPGEHVGNGAGDVLDFTPITGGTGDGPRRWGTGVPGGGDWSVRRGPTLYELDARYLICADDGALIDIVNRGFYRTKTVSASQRCRGASVRKTGEVRKYTSEGSSSSPASMRAIAPGVSVR